MPKTVFFVVHIGFAARYLLRTDILETLRAAGVRVVVLAPNPDEKYFAEEFAGPLVVLEPLRVRWEDKTLVTRSRLWSLLYYLRSYTLAGGQRTRALLDKYRAFRVVVRQRNALLALGMDAVLAVLWRSRLLRGALLAAESRLYAPDVHGDLFERYDPDLVVTTSPGWFLPDAIVLREASTRGIPAATTVLSWDNPSSKGYRGATPDRMVVWSDEMARQTAEYHDYPRERIVVGGVPHFDQYVRKGGLLSREELFTRLGLDPARRLVVFATSLPRTFERSLDVAEELARAIEEDELGFPAQLVVRLHPMNFKEGERSELAAYERLTSGRRHVHLDVPEIVSDRLVCDLSADDGLRLGSLIRHCDVLVNVFSTTTLEAFLADRPVVLVSPRLDRTDDDGGQRRFHDYAHVRSIMESGAARVAESLPEVTEHVRGYLADPSLDRARRLEVAARELGPADGRAGARTAGYLLELLGEKAAERSSTPSAEEGADLRAHAPHGASR